MKFVTLVLIERFFQGLYIAFKTVRIVKELMEIWLNEVCDIVERWEKNLCLYSPIGA